MLSFSGQPEVPTWASQYPHNANATHSHSGSITQYTGKYNPKQIKQCRVFLSQTLHCSIYSLYPSGRNPHIGSSACHVLLLLLSATISYFRRTLKNNVSHFCISRSFFSYAAFSSLLSRKLQASCPPGFPFASHIR